MPVHESPEDRYGRHEPSLPEAVQRREAGRRRVGNATRWTLAAAVAGASVLGAGYAHVIPGIAARPPANSPGVTHSSTSGGLQPPASTPGATSKAPHTQSGAS
jgi:hypothetical protein